MVEVRQDDTPRNCSTLGGVGQASCGVVGFLVAVAGLIAGYSGVVAVASIVPLLSTTTIVFVGVTLWLFTWLALVVSVDAVRRMRGPAGV